MLFLHKQRYCHCQTLMFCRVGFVVLVLQISLTPVGHLPDVASAS